MAGRKRTPSERQLDLHIVAAGMALAWTNEQMARAVNEDRCRRAHENAVETLRKEGKRPAEIEAELARRPPVAVEISRQQISYDKKAAEAILIELTQRHAREEIGRQLIRLDEIWTEAMEAWRNSKDDAKEVVVKRGIRTVRKGTVVELVPVETKVIRTAPRAGDPRHLKVALEAIQERTDLLRLRERELTEKVAEHPQFDASRPTTLEDATEYLESTAGSRFARHGRLQLVHPKQRHKR